MGRWGEKSNAKNDHQKAEKHRRMREKNSSNRPPEGRKTVPTDHQKAEKQFQQTTRRQKSTEGNVYI